jgi:hypothetical protein
LVDEALIRERQRTYVQCGRSSWPTFVTEKRSENMGLKTGDFPPVDPTKLFDLPYLERVKLLSRHWVDYGFGAPKITHSSTWPNSSSSTSPAGYWSRRSPRA